MPDRKRGDRRERDDRRVDRKRGDGRKMERAEEDERNVRLGKKGKGGMARNASETRSGMVKKGGGRKMERAEEDEKNVRLGKKGKGGMAEAARGSKKPGSGTRGLHDTAMAKRGKKRDPRREGKSTQGVVIDNGSGMVKKGGGRKMERAEEDERNVRSSKRGPGKSVTNVGLGEKDVDLDSKPGAGSKSGLIEPLIYRREKRGKGKRD